MTLRPAFSLGQTVYLRIDPERVGMVTGIIIRPGHQTFLVVWAEDAEESPHYEMELTEDRAFTTTTTTRDL